MSHIRADFEGLLELAEKLQSSLQQLSYRHGQLATLQEGLRLLMSTELAAGILIAVTCLSPHVAFFGRLLDPDRSAVFLGGVDVLFSIFTVRYFLSVIYQARQIQQAKQSDERDLTEVVELLREIEPVYAKEEKLSALERVQIRIRLSRFGIGSSVQRGLLQTPKELQEKAQAYGSRVDKELFKPL